jgi:hypothetical protein
MNVDTRTVRIYKNRICVEHSWKHKRWANVVQTDLHVELVLTPRGTIFRLVCSAGQGTLRLLPKAAFRCRFKKNHRWTGPDRTGAHSEPAESSPQFYSLFIYDQLFKILIESTYRSLKAVSFINIYENSYAFVTSSMLTEFLSNYILYCITHINKWRPA